MTDWTLRHAVLNCLCSKTRVSVGGWTKLTWGLWSVKQHRDCLYYSVFSFVLLVFSLSNTVSLLEVVGVRRVRSTVNNRVHEADHSHRLDSSRITLRLRRP